MRTTKRLAPALPGRAFSFDGIRRSVLGGDDDDAVGAARPVEGRLRRVLEDLDALDVGEAQPVDAVVAIADCETSLTQQQMATHQAQNTIMAQQARAAGENNFLEGYLIGSIAAGRFSPYAWPVYGHVQLGQNTYVSNKFYSDSRTTNSNSNLGRQAREQVKNPSKSSTQVKSDTGGTQNKSRTQDKAPAYKAPSYKAPSTSRR